MRIYSFGGNFDNDGASIGGAGTGGQTMFIRDQDWGILSTHLGYDSAFGDPAGETGWSGGFSGGAGFGQYQRSGQTHYDEAVIYADVTSGTWANGNLSADLNGKFMTMTKRGTIEGKVFGSYATDPNQWQAMAMGEWHKTDDLTFSSAFDGFGYKLVTRDIDSYLYTDGSTYFWMHQPERDLYYDYFEDYTNNIATETYYLSNDWYQQWVYDIAQNGALTEFNARPYTELPDRATQPPGDIVTDDYGNSDGNRIYAEASISGYMGGLDDLWTSTEQSKADITFLGEFTANLPGPFLFQQEVQSFNPYDGTFTAIPAHRI